MNVETLRAAALALSLESTGDDVLTVRGEFDRLREIVAEMKVIIEDKSIEWIEVHGDLVIGDVRYYVGKTKTTKCVEPSRTLDAAFVATGGDIAAVGGLLASNPFKHGACREVLGDKWGEHFVEADVVDLKEGKPKRSVVKFDPRFAKGAS